jgi:hypothetical protein
MKPGGLQVFSAIPAWDCRGHSFCARIPAPFFQTGPLFPQVRGPAVDARGVQIQGCLSTDRSHLSHARDREIREGGYTAR